jgi:Ricin-type beta-trefoil lectin domain
MRTLKAVVFTALASGTISLVGTPPAHAAVLSVGSSNGTFGGYVCADVRDGNLANLTPIDAFDCNAAPNQQFEFNGFTIYALGGQRCIDVAGAGRAAGTPVDSYPCNGTVAQVWYYYNGEIYNPNSGMCLDAGNMSNQTQLYIYPCNRSISQNWQIK